MKNIKYKLEPYKGKKTRHQCPKCGDKHSLTFYVDCETGQPLNSEVGRCNHEGSCGYHSTPLDYYVNAIPLFREFKSSKNYIPMPPKRASYFDKKHLIESEINNQNNNFITYLRSFYEPEDVVEIITRYRIGTSEYWDGATIFWYLDKRSRICSGKVMLYDKKTGKRIKTDGIPWINSMRTVLINKGLIDGDFNQKSGLYGEHLLLNNKKPVCIVESEKTAIYASLEFPDYLWLAAGGRSFLTDERLKVLKGIEVTLYPDNDAFELWEKVASKYRFRISTLVKESCAEPNADLVDYISSLYDD